MHEKENAQENLLTYIFPIAHKDVTNTQGYSNFTYVCELHRKNHMFSLLTTAPALSVYL
jgi:hypothetical protein